MPGVGEVTLTALMSALTALTRASYAPFGPATEKLSGAMRMRSRNRSSPSSSQPESVVATLLTRVMYGSGSTRRHIWPGNRPLPEAPASVAFADVSTKSSPAGSTASDSVANMTPPDCVVTRVPAGMGTAKASAPSTPKRTVVRAGCGWMRITPIGAPRWSRCPPRA